MKEKKSEKQKKISVVKEFLKTEKGKAILFFSFYAVFFLVVSMLLRAPRNSSNSLSGNEHLFYSYHVNLLENKNYHFKYLETIGDSIRLYEGDKKGDEENFSVTEKDLVTAYYRDNELLVRKNNLSNIWKMSDNPYLAKEFYDVSTIKEILKKAKFLSKTEFENLESELNFTITTADLAKILGNQEIINEDSNEIVVKLNKDKEIVGIVYTLSNYYTYQYQMPIFATIEITYSKFAEIEKIEKPE